MQCVAICANVAVPSNHFLIMNFAQFVSFYFSELWAIDGFKRVSRSTLFDGTQYTVTGEFDINPGLTLKDVADFIHKRLNKFQYDGNARVENAIN